ncbi:MAG TPA: addiction module antidote protein [Aquirhabdus sp.]
MMKKFDIAEHLKTESDIREFLQEAAETGDSSDFLHAVGIAARAKGMSIVASEAGVSRASLYKALSEDGKPAFETVFKVVKSFGLTLAVH